MTASLRNWWASSWANCFFLKLTGKFSNAIERWAYQSKKKCNSSLWILPNAGLIWNGSLQGSWTGRKQIGAPRIIFATAYHQFAHPEGYKVDALDLFWLKPYSYEGIFKCCHKSLGLPFERLIQNEQSETRSRKKPQSDLQFSWKLEYPNFVKVSIKEIGLCGSIQGLCEGFTWLQNL